MQEIDAEGTRFIYFPASASRDGIEAARQIDPRFNVEAAYRFLREPDVRLAFFRTLLPPNRLLPYYLVWADGTDLSDLDLRVQAGTHRDDDFHGSIRAYFQVTRCFSCGNRYPTLVVDSGDPYPAAFNLLRRKISRLQVKPCPRCRGSLRQLVAKLIED